MTKKADSAFRAQLVADPEATVEQEIGLTVPEGFSLHVHEATATSAHLVEPPAGGRLDPDEMQIVMGGATAWFPFRRWDCGR